MERPTRSTTVWLLLFSLSLSLVAASAQTFKPVPSGSAFGRLNSVPRHVDPALSIKPKTVLVPGILKNTRHPLVVSTPKANSAFRRTFRRLMRNLRKTDRYDEIILRHANARGLDPRLLKAVIAAESEFTRNARSPAGARGLMQLMPRTAEEFGVSRRVLDNPERNVAAGAAYLEHLFSRIFKKYKLKGVPYKNAPLWVVQRVIASYHAGPRFLYKDRWFRSTRAYVKKVLLFYQSRVTDIRRMNSTVKLPSVLVPVQTSTGTFD